MHTSHLPRISSGSYRSVHRSRSPVRRSRSRSHTRSTLRDNSKVAVELRHELDLHRSRCPVWRSRSRSRSLTRSTLRHETKPPAELMYTSHSHRMSSGSSYRSVHRSRSPVNTTRSHTTSTHGSKGVIESDSAQITEKNHIEY